MQCRRTDYHVRKVRRKINRFNQATSGNGSGNTPRRFPPVRAFRQTGLCLLPPVSPALQYNGNAIQTTPRSGTRFPFRPGSMTRNTGRPPAALNPSCERGMRLSLSKNAESSYLFCSMLQNYQSRFLITVLKKPRALLPEGYPYLS